MKSRVWLGAVLITLLLPQPVIHAEDDEELINQSTEQVIEPSYRDILNDWENEGLDSIVQFERAISPSSFENVDDDEFVPESESLGYDDRVLYWHNNESIEFEVEVEQDGLYEIGFDYYPLGEMIMPIEGAIEVNEEFLFNESRRVVFPVNWEDERSEFEVDRFGHEIVPEQQPIQEWGHFKVHDANHLNSRPFKYYLEEGTNTVSLTNLRGEMLLGNAYITSPEDIPDYETYLNEFPNDHNTAGTLLTFEAEYPAKKNNSYIRPEAVQHPSVVPYDSKSMLLNSFGGDSWSESGQSVTWNINVEEEGFYNLSFKALQNKEAGSPVFRTIFINGSLPFEEVEQYQFKHSNSWYNETIGSEEGEPYLFYFEEGSNTITLTADASPVERVLATVDDVMKEMEDLSLSIRRLTGNETDRNRDWNIDEYIPEVESLLLRWADWLDEEAEYLSQLTGVSDSTEVVALRIAVDRLTELSQNPNEIPNRLTELSEGSNSVAQLLGNLLTEVQEQPLLLDRFYVHRDEELPNAEAGFFEKVTSSVSRFFQSFTVDNYATTDVDEDTVDVWVNRPRQYVDLLQNMLDQNFTPETGIEVSLSVMPDESKLILASAANTQPDLALSISNWLPFELAIRGAAVDLREFEDFHELGQDFSPGAFLPLIVDDGIYGMPETQDFFVQFYRRDIMDYLQIPVPDTWDDVVSILPELQRYGLNYYTPIASEAGFKPFQATAPYIYQFGGDLYKEDGIGTEIDSEESLRGIQFMNDLNTVYSAPLQVPNFYNHFRYSTLPIGIASFSEYVQLTAAAPEISGWWDISLHPGLEQDDGTVNRWATGSAQTSMIFDGQGKTDEAWEVLKWWMSTDTQTEFANRLLTMYGPEYMWNTANLEAFGQLPWPEEHKETILEQWEHLKEVPKTPYSYMVEREISNVWNQVVFEGENTRSAVDDSVVTIDREMRRKLEEFGYIENGEVVRPYRIPTIEMVEGWLETDENE